MAMIGYVNKRRPRQLRNLEISEVSAVDRGAGEGVRVLLMKRQNESVLMKRYHYGEGYKSEGTGMTALESIMKSIETPAEMLIKAIVAKQIDAMDSWKVIVKLATSAFPNLSEQQATTAYLFDGTHAEGRAVSKAYREMPDLTNAEKVDRIVKAASHGKPAKAFDGALHSNASDTIPDGENVAHHVLRHLAAKFMKTPEGKRFKSVEAAADFLADHDDTARKARNAAIKWDREQALRKACPESYSKAANRYPHDGRPGEENPEAEHEETPAIGTGGAGEDDENGAAIIRAAVGVIADSHLQRPEHRNKTKLQMLQHLQRHNPHVKALLEMAGGLPLEHEAEAADADADA